MCGHVGVAGSILLDEKKAFSNLLFLDYLRGPHSTGVAAVHLTTKFSPYEEKMDKALGGPWELMGKPEGVFKDGVVKSFPHVIMGHNRFATQGTIDEDSAHPFQFENLIGAHNGTVNKASLSSFHGAKELNLDSRMIYSQLNHDDNLQKVWDLADGAMALVWWDKRDNCMHFARNKDRSLFYTFSKSGKTVFWASEAWMLTVSLSRNGIQFEDIKPFAIDTHYTIDMYNEKLELKSSVLNPFQKGVTTFTGGWRENWKSWMGYDNDEGWGQDKSHTQKAEEGKDKTSKGAGYGAHRFFRITEWSDSEKCFWGQTTLGDIIKINIGLSESHPKFKEQKERLEKGGKDSLWKVQCHDSHFKAVNNYKFAETWAAFVIEAAASVGLIANGFKKEKLNKVQWEDKTKCGCDNCKRIVEWKDHRKIKWYTTDNFFCEDCLNLPYVKEILSLAYSQTSGAH